MKNMRFFALSALLFCACMGFAIVSTSTAAGTTATSTSGASLTDKPFLSVVSAADLQNAVKAARGKTVILNFFASWCPPCRVEMPDLIQLRKDLSPEKLLILAVSMDDNPAAVEKMRAEFPFNFPVFMGGPDVGRTYSISAIPRNVVYAPDGTEIFNDAGILDCDSVREFVETAGRK